MVCEKELIIIVDSELLRTKGGLELGTTYDTVIRVDNCILLGMDESVESEILLGTNKGELLGTKRRLRTCFNK